MPGRDANLTGPQHQGPGEFTTAYGSQDLAAASGAIFTVTGMVKVRNIVGAVTTVLATSTSLAIFAGATAVTASTAILTLTTLTALVRVNATLTSPLIAVAGGTGSLYTSPTELLIGSAGSTTTISATLNGSGTGVIRWGLEYLPMTEGAKILAAQ